MVHLLRALILGVLALLLPSAALADTSYNSITQDKYQRCVDDSFAQYNYGSYSAPFNWALSWTTSTNLRCTFNYYFGSSYRTGTYNYYYANRCPFGGTYSAGVCVSAPACAAGEIRNYDTGVCEPEPPPACDQPGQYLSPLDGQSCICQEGYTIENDGSCTSTCTEGSAKQLFSIDRAMRGCQGGCGFTREGVPGGSSCSLHMSMYGDSGAAYECSYVGTGSNCSPAEEEPEPPGPDAEPPAADDPEAPEPPQLPESPCGPGTCGGTVNGQSVCLPCDTVDSRSRADVTTTNPDGSTTQRIVDHHDEVDEDGQIRRRTTTRTINRDPNGDVVSDDTEESDGTFNRGGFCEENPDAAICGEEGDYGAECGSDFVCEGDAIQCGIAREVHLARCAALPSDEVIEAGNLLLTEDGSMSQLLTDALNQEVAVTDLDASGMLGGRTCPSDRSVTVMGQSFSIPFSSICPYLEMFGYLMIAIGGLLSIRIIGRSI